MVDRLPLGPSLIRTFGISPDGQGFFGAGRGRSAASAATGCSVVVRVILLCTWSSFFPPLHAVFFKCMASRRERGRERARRREDERKAYPGSRNRSTSSPVYCSSVALVNPSYQRYIFSQLVVSAPWSTRRRFECHLSPPFFMSSKKHLLRACVRA